VIPPRFEDVKPFAHNGLAAVKKDKKWGYINTQGKMVIPPRFDHAGDFAANGLALVSEASFVNSGYINTRGEWVIPPKFIEYAWRDVGLGRPKGCVVDIPEFAPNGLMLVEENGKFGYMNVRGKMVIAPRFDHAGDFSANDLAVVKENGKWGFINAQGEWVIAPRFEAVNGFATNGLAVVKENGKWGYINGKGEWVIPPRFNFAGSFASNGLAWIFDNGKTLYINAKGKTIAFVDEVCGFQVLKNARGEITWPKKTEAQICEEQKK